MKTITILVSCLYGLSLYAQNDSHKFKNEIFKIYDSSYILDTLKYISQKDFESGFIKPFRNDELKEVESVDARSKKLYQNKYRIYLNFYIYRYSSSSASKSTFSLLCKQHNLEDANYFDKDYDYVFIKDNLIIRLNAPCLLSKQNWNKLVDQISDVSNKLWGDKNTSSSIECFCGGNCKIN